MRFKGSEAYVSTDDLTLAVNAAITLERPLLVKGEPGTGKTMLAVEVARALGLPLLEWHIKSTTKAQQGLYEYDAVSRLRDSQLGDPRVREIRNYIVRGMLWQAFTSETPVVLLIDEIDKADIEFPNDLLRELDRMEFFVYETRELIKATQRPIVFITSNNEKELPDAFLRRCFFHYIRFPDRETMEKIVKVHFHDLLHRFPVGEADVVEETTPQKGVGQLFFVVRGDEDDGALCRLDELPRLVHEELHAVELAQKVVGKLDVGLVDLVDEEHDRRLGSERLPQHAADDVVADLAHAGVAKLGIAQAAHRVVLVQALLRLGRGFDVPFEERQPERPGHFDGEHGLAGARLAFYQQRALERDRRVDREREVVGGDVSFRTFESHQSAFESGCASLYTIVRCVHCFRRCCASPFPPERRLSPSTWGTSSKSRARPAPAGAPSWTSTGSSRPISSPPREAGDWEPCLSARTVSRPGSRSGLPTRPARI